MIEQYVGRNQILQLNFYVLCTLEDEEQVLEQEHVELSAVVFEGSLLSARGNTITSSSRVESLY